MSLGNPSFYRPTETDRPRYSGFQVHSGDAHPPARSSKGAWLALFLLTGALVAAVQYGRVSLQRQDAQLAALPALQEAFTSTTKLVEQARNDLNAWAIETDGLRQRLNKFESAVRRDLKLTQGYIRETTGQLAAQLRSEDQARTNATLARFENLEAQQAAHQERLAAVEKQVHEEIALLRSDTQKGIGGLERRVDGADRSIEAVAAAQTNPQRVEFQLPRGRPVEIASGVSVQVSKINVNEQQFDARVKLVPEGQTLTVQRHSAYQPVRFYSKQEGQPYELVVTDATRDFVVGYLVLPRRSTQAAADATPLASRRTSLDP